MLIDTAITVPRSGGNASPVTLDLTGICKAECRIMEVAVVTPQKAPELLATFNSACLELSRFVTFLESEHIYATRAAARIKGTILLDKVPTILKEKGLSNPKSPAGSEDMRNAILDVDEEYQAALDRVYEMSCYMSLLKGKLKNIEMAYSSVKKILGEGAFNYKQDLGDSMQSGYGKPKY